MRRFPLFASLYWAACLFAASAQDQPPAATPSTFEELMTAANSKYTHRDYAASRALYDQARQLVEQEQAPAEDQRRYDVLKRLTTVASASGDYAAANQYLDAAIQWRIDRMGSRDPQSIADRLQQVGIYRAMGDDAQAKIALETVIVKHEEIGGRRSAAVADDHSLMGQIDFESQQKEEAAQEWQLAIVIRGLNAGPLDVTQVPDLDRLGGACIELRRYPQAEDTFRRALIIRESVLGSEHADLLATLDGLAYAYFGQQKYDEAEVTYRRLIALWTKAVGETHPMLAIALDKLGVFYAAQKRHDEARAAYEHANAIRALVFAKGLVKQADDALTNGDPPETAAVLYRRALSALEPPNPIYDETREKIAAALQPPDDAAAKKAPPKTAPKK